MRANLGERCFRPSAEALELFLGGARIRGRRRGQRVHALVQPEQHQVEIVEPRVVRLRGALGCERGDSRGELVQLRGSDNARGGAGDCGLDPGDGGLQVAAEADELAVRLGRRGRRRRDRGCERVDALDQDVEATRVTSVLLRVVLRRREHASPCVPSTRAVRSPAGGRTCSLKGYRSSGHAPRSPFSGT